VTRIVPAEENLAEQARIQRQSVPNPRVTTGELMLPGGSLGLVDGWDFDVSAIGKQQHLIDGVLEQRSISWLVGPSGSYKTFIAMSMAVAVATGQPWHGRQTLRAPVVYICAEGGRAWERRMAAHVQVHGLPTDREPLHMRPMPVMIGSPEWTALHTLCFQIQPGLVVIDTQAQCSTADENSNTEMSSMIRHLTRMAQDIGAHVLTVHHSGHGANGQAIRARGASAIYAAADTELTVTPKDDVADGLKLRYVDLEATKQKDMETGHVATLAPHVVAIDGAADWKGRAVSSVVMVAFDPAEDPDADMTPSEWAERLIRAGLNDGKMGRDALTKAADAQGLTLPGKNGVRSEITRLWKEACARREVSAERTMTI
jgi:hypothetical protein